MKNSPKNLQISHWNEDNKFSRVQINVNILEKIKMQKYIISLNNKKLYQIQERNL